MNILRTKKPDRVRLFDLRLLTYLDSCEERALREKQADTGEFD